MQEVYCKWYDKQLEDVTEHEQEQCKENGQDCEECPDKIINQNLE